MWKLHRFVSMLAVSVVQPSDLLKTYMQLLGPAGEKMSAFATYATARLGTFRLNYGVPSFPKKALMGKIAGGAGALVGNSDDVALIRMTADGRLPPENSNLSQVPIIKLSCPFVFVKFNLSRDNMENVTTKLLRTSAVKNVRRIHR